MDNGRILFDPADRGLLELLLKRTVLQGEEALMLAVLADAIECFQKYVLATDEKGKKLFIEAQEWILETNSNWLFSFENICEVLRLDPNYTRQGLLCWKETRRNPQVTKRKVKKSAFTVAGRNRNAA
jgi:hypothetical protein